MKLNSNYVLKSTLNFVTFLTVYIIISMVKQNYF